MRQLLNTITGFVTFNASTWNNNIYLNNALAKLRLFVQVQIGQTCISFEIK